MIQSLIPYIKYATLRIRKDIRDYKLGREGNDLSIDFLLEEFRGKKSGLGRVKEIG